MQTEPIDLYECFRAFTKEEELGEDELWYGFNSFVNLSSLFRVVMKSRGPGIFPGY